MLIVIEKDEYAHVLKAAKSKAESGQFKRNTNWKKGLKNTVSDPFKVERHGILGEYAFCKFSGEEYNWIETGKKYDFVFNDETIDVKAIEYYQLLINTDVGFTADKCVVFRILEDNGNDKAILKLQGWCSRKDILSAPIEKSPRRNAAHYNYVVDFSMLRPLSLVS